LQNARDEYIRGTTLFRIYGNHRFTIPQRYNGLTRRFLTISLGKVTQRRVGFFLLLSYTCRQLSARILEVNIPYRSLFY